MNDQVKQIKQIKSVSQIVTELRSRFPIFQSDQPLAIGIHHQLQADYPEREVAKALGRHTSTTTYLHRVKYSENRFNLDGTIASVITDDQKEAARLCLNTRHSEKKRADRLKRHAENPKKMIMINSQHDRIKARNLIKLGTVVKAIQV